MSPTLRLIAVDVYTAGYRIVGKAETGSSGLIGLFNDDTTSFVTLQNASIAHIQTPTKLLARHPAVQLTKRGIHAVCVASHNALGPITLLRGGFRKVFSYRVFAASQVYEFSGYFKWSGKFDPKAILAKGKSDFLAFYDGEVRAILFPSLRVEAAGMLINRRKIDVLAHIPEKDKVGEKNL